MTRARSQIDRRERERERESECERAKFLMRSIINRPILNFNSSAISYKRKWEQSISRRESERERVRSLDWDIVDAVDSIVVLSLLCSQMSLMSEMKRRPKRNKQIHFEIKRLVFSYSGTSSCVCVCEFFDFSIFLCNRPHSGPINRKSIYK